MDELPTMPERLTADVMALRVAREFHDGDVVNLGVGLPLQCCNYVPADREVLFHSEQGIVGFGPIVTDPAGVSIWLVNAGGQPIAARPGMVVMSHDESFAMIRGGHLDISVLGAMQVAANGDLANTQLPGKIVGNIGGAQDLAVGAKKLIVMMYHTTPGNEPKIVPACSLPLTAPRCVDMIVTDVGVFELSGGRVHLKEFAPGWTVESVQAITAVPLAVDAGLTELSLV
jgi:3-oxoacid CoA-transferase B subunit